MILVTVSLIDIASRNIRKRFIEADSDNAEVLKGEKR